MEIPDSGFNNILKKIVNGKKEGKEEGFNSVPTATATGEEIGRVFRDAIDGRHRVK